MKDSSKRVERGIESLNLVYGVKRTIFEVSTCAYQKDL
jgi:hypothetical protein